MKQSVCMKEFEEIINDITENETVQEMKKYKHHGNTNTFSHCYNVSYNCYKICKKLNLDYISVARAGMLHDFFLYDWKEKDKSHRFHGFIHGKIACENACKIFDLNEKEKDMIIKHMWPLTIKPPKSREGIILAFVDKHCAIKETLRYVFRKRK